MRICEYVFFEYAFGNSAELAPMQAMHGVHAERRKAAEASSGSPSSGTPMYTSGTLPHARINHLPSSKTNVPLSDHYQPHTTKTNNRHRCALCFSRSLE